MKDFEFGLSSHIPSVVEDDSKRAEKVAKKIISDVKLRLSADPEISNLIYTHMIKIPGFKRMIDAFGENEETRKFIINEFFEQPPSRTLFGFKPGSHLAVSRGSEEYNVMWSKDEYESFTINKLSTNTIWSERSTEIIAVSDEKDTGDPSGPCLNYTLDGSGKEPLFKSGHEAISGINSFLKDLLHPEKS